MSKINGLDLLTKYNGNSITYDTIGNPTGYYNGAAITWQKGRQLVAYTSGGTTTAYTYGMTGQRVRETVGSAGFDVYTHRFTHSLRRETQ